MSDQDPNILSKLLQEHDLSPNKWVPLFHNEGITTAVHVVANKGSDEIFESLSSKADTEGEKRSLSKLLEIYEAANSTESEIVSELVVVGLEPTRWLPILKTQLGLRTPQGLQHIGSESYTDLVRYSHKPWEKKALRTFLGIDDGETAIKSLRETQQEKLRQREEKCQQMLEELSSLQKQGKDYHDKVVSQLMDGIQEALQIPEGSWIVKGSSLEALIDGLNMIIEQLRGELMACRDLSDVEVLNHASGGRALQGILVSRNLEDQLETRENLLSAPQDVQLKAPFLYQDDKIEKFSSQEQEDKFVRSMDSLGYSATVSAKAGFLGFGVQMSASYSKTTEEEHHQKEMYCSTIKYLFVPMASFHFSDRQLQLSADALRDLQAIETFSESQTALQEHCEQYFRKYGSHANKGHLHFGGVYWLRCHSYGFCKSDLAEVRRLQNQIISSLVLGLPYEGIGAPVKGNVTELKERFKVNFSEALISKTTVEVTKNGGPQAATNIPLWKSGLVASNSTWNVIDRGSITVPVWEIVQMNHMKSFKNPKKLLQTLIAAWEEMTKLQAMSLGGEIALQEEAHSADILVAVSKWNDQKDQKSCELHLKQLTRLKIELAQRSMTPQAWPVIYLSKPVIQNYLQWVMKVTEDSESQESIKLLMQQLVDPLDLNLVEIFFNEHCISKWLYQSNEGDVIPLECKDLLSLQTFLKQANFYLAQTKSDTGTPQQQAKIQATACVLDIINYLRNHLLKANQKYEDLFIVTLLYPFRYDVIKKIFLRLLSSDDLEYLIKNLEEQSTEYFSVKKTRVVRKQAYLFHLAIGVFDSAASSVDVSESHMKQHLLYMQKTLQNELLPEVNDVISMKCTDSDTCYDWTVIQSDLSSLMSDFNFAQEHEGPVLEDILQATPEARDDIGIAAKITVTVERHLRPKVAPQIVVTHKDTYPKPKVPQIRTQREASDALQFLLEMVNLAKYYPQKLTRTDSVCIRKETLGSLQYTEQPELLPYYIMQKIMMHNYKSRTNILRHHQTGADTDSDSDDDDDEEEEETDSEDEQITTSTHNIHPMDGLLALIHCADNFLRQDLIVKLSTCKLAIPFLLPDPKAQTLTFPLWSMQSIVKEWKSKGGDMECRIVDCKTPIVSFLRFSQSEISKSKMLNDVIGDSDHDFFFHWNSEGGSAKRLLVDGLVELCWYLPADKESDHFPNIVTFTNLHGDAREHDKQTTFLSQVSFMNFVLLTQRDLNDQRAIILLQELAKAQGGLVLMFSDTNKVKIPKETLTKEMYSRLKLKTKNDATIKNEIRGQIKKKLNECEHISGGVAKQLRLTDCGEIAKKTGILVDEDIQECKEGKQLAIELVEKILLLDTDPDSTASAKDRMLPLQGPKLWHVWAKHDKEQHRHLNRGSKGIEQYNSEKEKEKIAIRRKQLGHANLPTPIMKLFIVTLLQQKDDIREYFLQWVKILLDDRSRDKLPGLHRQYKAKRKEINKLKDQQDVDSSEFTTLQSELKTLNEQLVHTSFGLEHLLRELGQMYESVWDVSKLKTLHGSKHNQWQMITASEQLQSEVFRLPQVAAELLVFGYPLELMDGDASHLPLTWVSSVLDKVKEILGDKRLFILSVLGIQSTGKSTLLNTMFGLQFTVSAGRCTRGAFIQLLPLSEQLKADIMCDYLLIVDTEGLRAPELDSAGTQRHDNEMATFVIGLADVTVINIFGEAPGDMDDILQTAVHALLRMKNVELDPSCQFVHQNVAAISADTKGKMGRDMFHEKLDEMTKAAAKEEQCEGQYQSFKDVILFDDEKDIWYFPTLWKGDPPMAPVNPGYSDMAQKLKFGLITLAREKGSQCTISGFQSRIKQLWGAVLDENFVFSFKNILEITIYNELDAEYNKWSWTLERTMLEWEQENETVISNTTERLHDLEKKRIAIAKTLLAKVHQKLRDDMKKFFQESKHSETLAQWQDRTERRLDDLRAEREKQAEEHCRTAIRNKEAHISVDREQDDYREELLKHVKQLVSKLEGEKLSEAELKTMFEEKWKEWMEEFTAKLPRVYQQDVNIDTSFERCLRDLLRKHDQQIIGELRQRPLRDWGNPLELTVQPDKHLQSCRWYSTRLGSSLGITGIKKEDIDYAQLKTETFLQTATQYVQDLKKRSIQNFSDGFIYELFNTVFGAVNQFNQGKNIFRFTQVYKVDIALTVGGYALRHFVEMMELVRKKNDPIEYLKTLKVPLFKTFKGQYSQSTEEKTAADNLCYLLRTPIVTAVTGSLGCMVADDMKTRPTFHSKRALKAQILLDLGERKSFECFEIYLTNAKASLQYWVEAYTKQHCAEVIGGKSKLEKLSETKLQEVIRAITEAAEDVTSSFQSSRKANISDWLSQLHKQLSSVLAFGEREIKEVVGTENLKDFHFFKDEIIKGLHKIQKSLLTNFQLSPLSQMDKWSKQPYDILCKTLLGCCEQCPFCKEQCELTTPDHDCDCKHSVELHRPQCLGGYRWIASQEMTLSICSSSVASNATFENDDTKWKLHPYKEYQTYYPEWIITSDSSRQAASFWKWFVANYSVQIAKHFNMKETQIPDTWTSLTWGEVKKDLKTSYNL